MTECTLSSAPAEPVRTPNISVVIPTHRDRGYLASTLRSLLPQLRAADHVYLCANGCTEEYLRTLATLASAQVTVLESPVAGIAFARNFGAMKSDGAFLLFLDDDDELAPDALEVLREALATDPAIVGVTGDVRTISSQGERDTGGVLTDFAAFEWERLLGGPPTASMGSALIRRSAYLAVAGLDETVAPADDWDLWLKLARIGKIVGLRRVTLRYRLHEHNASLNVSLMTQQALAVFRRHELAGESSASARRRALARVRRWYVPRLARASLTQARQLNLVASTRSIAAVLALYRATLRGWLPR
ncbi:MAG: glycosyltransferase family 2 protein [Gemmatimonadota bacterium]